VQNENIIKCYGGWKSRKWHENNHYEANLIPNIIHLPFPRDTRSTVQLQFLPSGDALRMKEEEGKATTKNRWKFLKLANRFSSFRAP
jgi:hypothetical protein